MSERKLFMNQSFKVEHTEDNLKLLKTLRELAAKDGWTFSRLVREALTEYAKRHAPGNPQLALAHWTEDLAMPESIAETATQKATSEWKLRELQEKERGEARWIKLHSMTNDELIARQAKLNGREGAYMEVLEISLILTHRRLSTTHGPSLPTLPEEIQEHTA